MSVVVMTGFAGAALAAGGSSSSPTLLRVGSSGATISAVQRALGIPSDGVYGPRTRRAVMAYQRVHGLIVDGIVGPQTLSALGLGGQTVQTNGGDNSSSDSRLSQIAQCESGGNPSAVSPDGQYRGKYQFSRETWKELGGSGDPADAPESEQDRLAALLLERAGPSAWPVCGRS